VSLGVAGIVCKHRLGRADGLVVASHPETSEAQRPICAGQSRIERHRPFGGCKPKFKRTLRRRSPLADIVVDMRRREPAPGGRETGIEFTRAQE
jgi:hypothetical protein